jgi:two-component system NarL family response regulator
MARGKTMNKIHVLIVDDHTLFRMGVREMLEAEEDIDVVAEAATGREALEQARAIIPDVILMDIKMPDLDGVEATRILHQEMPHVGIIFVTSLGDEEFVNQGLQAGGLGYILKDAGLDTMLRAIRAAAHGESLLGPTVAKKILRQPIVQPKKPDSLLDTLTPRELEVLTLVAEGCGNKEIAKQLSIAEKTVKNHINNVFSKLHVYDRTQAMLYAIRAGLVRIE